MMMMMMMLIMIIMMMAMTMLMIEIRIRWKKVFFGIEFRIETRCIPFHFEHTHTHSSSVKKNSRKKTNKIKFNLAGPIRIEQILLANRAWSKLLTVLTKKKEESKITVCVNQFELRE